MIPEGTIENAVVMDYKKIKNEILKMMVIYKRNEKPTQM